MAAKKKVSKKKVSKKKTSSKSTGKALMTMEQYEAEMAAVASADSARVEGGGAGANSMRIKGGTFTYKDADLGDTINVVVVHFSNEKAWYDTPYNQDDPSSPACYAVSMDSPKEMLPSDDAVKAQSDSCEECWANEYGSSETGRGKACNDRRRLMVVSEQDLDNELEDIEVALLRTSSTSTGAFDKYIKGLEKVHGRPVFGVITSVSFDEEVDYEKLAFKAVDKINNPAHMEKIFELRNTVEEQLMQGYDPDNYHEPKARKGPGKKVSKKKTAKKKGGRSKFA